MAAAAAPDAQQLARIRASVCPESVVWDGRRLLGRDEIAHSIRELLRRAQR